MTKYALRSRLPLRSATLSGLVVALLLVLGTGTTGASRAIAGGVVPQVDSAAPCAGTGAPPARWSHVTLIMFENNPLKNIVGNDTDAPYINQIARACSYSDNTQALSDTSLTNYIALTSGYTGCKKIDSSGTCTRPLEVTSNRSPATWPQASKSIFELMNATSPADADGAVQWAEDMPANCNLSSSGEFLIQHSPYQYYRRTQATTCPGYARPFPTDPTEVLSAKFNLVIPNRTHIMHKPNSTASERTRLGDAWLEAFLPDLLSSATYQAGDTAIILTWDEGNEWDGTVPLIVVTPYTTVGGVSSAPYNHYSTLKGIQAMLGQKASLLGHAGDAKRTSIRADASFRLR